MIEGWRDMIEHKCKTCGHALGYHRVSDDACPLVLGDGLATLEWSDDSKFEDVIPNSRMVSKMCNCNHIDDEIVERMRLLAKHDDCYAANDEWYDYNRTDFCTGCISHNNRPDYWDCNNEGESARRWLKEHGYKY